jgi:hypothetical protein
MGRPLLRSLWLYYTSCFEGMIGFGLLDGGRSNLPPPSVIHSFLDRGAVEEA